MHTHNDILSFPLCSTLFSHYMIYLKFKIIGSQVSSSCAFSSNWPFSCPFILPSPSFYYLVKPFSLWYFLSWLPFHVYSAIPRFHKLNTQSKDLRLGDIYIWEIICHFYILVLGELTHTFESFCLMFL